MNLVQKGSAGLLVTRVYLKGEAAIRRGTGDLGRAMLENVSSKAARCAVEFFGNTVLNYFADRNAR
jgi:hypothetical protein